MPTLRTGADEQQELALDALSELSAQLSGLDVVPTGTEQVRITPVGEPGLLARVVARSVVGEAEVRALRSASARGHKLVVADQISAQGRQLLTALGWSWLDRRVGAQFNVGSRSVEVVFVARPEGTADLRRFHAPRLSAEGPIRGRAGISYAAAVLCRPDGPPSLRSVATDVGMSPTSMSNAAKLLTHHGLVLRDGRPACPDLFDALAAVWGPLNVAPVAALPEPDDARLQARVASLDSGGWALGGDTAALELGAPMVAIGSRPVLWVPTQVELRRAERYLGATSWDERAAVLLVPPTPIVCRSRRPAGPSGWPLVHPVFAALDLAQDRGRGREILAKWNPEGVRVVWR